MEKDLKKERYTCICITESLCCTPRNLLISLCERFFYSLLFVLCTFLLYRNATHFCGFALCNPVQIYLLVHKRFCDIFWDFLCIKIIICKSNFTSYIQLNGFHWLVLSYSSLDIQYYLNKWWSRYPLPSSWSCEEEFTVFPPLSMMLAVVFHICPFNIEVFSFYSLFIRIILYEKCVGCGKYFFSISVEMAMWFISISLYMWYYKN